MQVINPSPIHWNRGHVEGSTIKGQTTQNVERFFRENLTAKIADLRSEGRTPEAIVAWVAQHATALRGPVATDGSQRRDEIGKSPEEIRKIREARRAERANRIFGDILREQAQQVSVAPTTTTSPVPMPINCELRLNRAEVVAFARVIYSPDRPTEFGVAQLRAQILSDDVKAGAPLLAIQYRSEPTDFLDSAYELKRRLGDRFLSWIQALGLDPRSHYFRALDLVGRHERKPMPEAARQAELEKEIAAMKRQLDKSTQALRHQVDVLQPAARQLLAAR